MEFLRRLGGIGIAGRGARGRRPLSSPFQGGGREGDPPLGAPAGTCWRGPSVNGIETGDVLARDAMRRLGGGGGPILARDRDARNGAGLAFEIAKTGERCKALFLHAHRRYDAAPQSGNPADHIVY